jgi:hypothetical protein
MSIWSAGRAEHPPAQRRQRTLDTAILDIAAAHGDGEVAFGTGG